LVTTFLSSWSQPFTQSHPLWAGVATPRPFLADKIAVWTLAFSQRGMFGLFGLAFDSFGGLFGSFGKVLRSALCSIRSVTPPG